MKKQTENEIERILSIKTLIEIYDRELLEQPFWHNPLCKKCLSLRKQRDKMIQELKEKINHENRRL